MAPKKNESKTPVVQEVTPVVPVQEAAPVKKGGAKKETPVKVEAAPAKVEAAPVKVEAAPAKKGGAKKAEPVAAAPVVAATEAPVVAATEAPVKKGGAKKAAPAKAPEVAPVAAAPVQEAGAKVAKVAKVPKVAKVAKAPKVAKAAKVAKVVKEEGEEGEEDADDKTRSFKVLLPNQEEYSGRFTGLTPYQAANKALSKYFRTLKNEDVSENINFSIKESTRGSKRNTYSYKGGRVKLATPIKYSIKSVDGEIREIVKEYKNQLVKVKKAEMKVEAPVAAV